VKPPLRLVRLLLHAATALCLLLCLATLALWIRSHSTTDQLYLYGFHDERHDTLDLTWWRQDVLQSSGGRIEVGRFLQAGDRWQPGYGKSYREIMEPKSRANPFHAATPIDQQPRYGRLSEGLDHAWGPFRYFAERGPRARGRPHPHRLRATRGARAPLRPPARVVDRFLRPPPAPAQGRPLPRLRL
jgi:hypothetical protein